MRQTWMFHSAGQIVFGPTASSQLGEILTSLAAKKVLVVTDQNLIKAGVVEKVLSSLGSAGVSAEIFPEGVPEPSLDVADKCIARAHLVRPDCLVAIGGGSNMDLAKICAVVYRHGGTPRDYVGDCKVPGPVLPMVAVPTTSGTGSEVTAASVLTDTQNAIKVGVLSNYMRPRVALVDPLLTLSCPPKVTADSGIDALTHAIEAYTAVDNAHFPLPPGEKTVYQGRHPLGDCLAEKAIRLVGQHLRTAVRDGQNLAAREGMSLGALLAGLAFSNVGVAAVHALEYPVGGAVHCSHGAGNGLLLPFVMRFNMPGREAEFAQIAALLGENTSGLSINQAAERAITAVENLKRDIGIPERLRDIGVKKEQLPTLASKAFGVKRILRVNPRPPSEADLLGILEHAF